MKGVILRSYNHYKAQKYCLNDNFFCYNLVNKLRNLLAYETYSYDTNPDDLRNMKKNISLVISPQQISGKNSESK